MQGVRWTVARLRKTVDSDDEVLLFPGGWTPKAKHVDSDDEVPLFPKGWVLKEKRDSDDDVPLFPEGCKRMRREKSHEKSVPKSTRLDSALERMHKGAAAGVNLI